MRGKDTQVELQSTAFDFVLKVLSIRALDLPDAEYLLELEKGNWLLRQVRSK
jgi:hypothetical protein